MRREEEPGAYTIEEMNQFRWEQTFGKNFPIKSKHLDSIVPVLIFAVAVWLVWPVIKWIWDEPARRERHAQEEAARKRREEAAEKRAQVERIERIKLKRERLRRKPEIEVSEEDET